MTTGITVSDEVATLCSDIKLFNKYKYVIFKINDNLTEIVLEKTGEKNSTFEDFIKEFPINEPKYAIYNFEYEVGNSKRNKTLFISWTPDICKVKEKMIYSSSKLPLKKSFNGSLIDIQANSASELTEEVIYEKIIRV